MVDKTQGNTKHPIPVHRVIKMTEKAMLLQFEDGAEHWLPLSQCYLQVMVPEWLVEQKSLRPMGMKTGPVYGNEPATPASRAQQSMYEADDNDRPF